MEIEITYILSTTQYYFTSPSQIADRNYWWQVFKTDVLKSVTQKLLIQIYSQFDKKRELKNTTSFSQHFYYSLYNFGRSNKIVYTLTGYDSVGVYLILIIKPPSKALIWQSIFSCNYLSPVSWSLHNDLRLFSYLIRSLTIRAWYVPNISLFQFC